MCLFIHVHDNTPAQNYVTFSLQLFLHKMHLHPDLGTHFLSESYRYCVTSYLVNLLHFGRIMLTSWVQYCIDSPSVAHCFSQTQKQNIIQIYILSSITIKPTQTRSHTCTMLYKLIITLNICRIVLNHKLESTWKLRNIHKGVWVYLQASTESYSKPRSHLSWKSAGAFPFNSNGKRWCGPILPVVE